MYIVNVGWAYRASDPIEALQQRGNFMAYLHSMGLPGEDYFAAALAYGELVSNVLRHAPGPLEIVLEWDNDDAVLHIMDEGGGFAFKPALPSEALAEAGRGLYLVRKMTKDLRVLRREGKGAEVRVVLPVRRKRAQRLPA